MSLLEERQDSFLWDVVDLEPFVMLNTSLLDFLRNFTPVKSALIYHGHHAVYPQLLFKMRVSEDIESTQIQIAFIFLFFLVNADNVSALLLCF